ncbi:hypothetical protein BJ964_007264 [Actinoplanes lobatus]|uniref:Uncharacterized protein n=1 Tax=Actinoplanes lobatus TaxID=113568 RepID=A0A7W7HM80_9ACTN|nr:hypothetical protein [Actinoplanes lobatus]
MFLMLRLKRHWEAAPLTWTGNDPDQIKLW